MVHNMFTFNKVKVTSFGIHLFSHTLTLTSPGHWASLGNYCFGLPGKTISLPVLFAANIPCP